MQPYSDGAVRKQQVRPPAMFDNLECISVYNQSTGFPKHFHETFCISLIHKGIERIDLGDQSLFSEAGSISITNPYEVHSNPLMESVEQVAFDTIYVSQDLMKSLLHGKNLRFANRKINDPSANHLFQKLTLALQAGEIEKTEILLHKFAGLLQVYAEQRQEDYQAMTLDRFSQVNEFIENNLTSKFTLAELAGVANINKYGFSKIFKASTGMSPMSYLLMRKVFSAKNQILKSTDLTQLAFDYDFADLPHFSKTFKKFVGISPKQYQLSLQVEL